MTTTEQAPPAADIVIVNWNTGHHLRDCLRSVARADRSELRVERVVVVDNASEDDSLSSLTTGGIPLDLIRNTGNRGFAAACNQGAARCGSAFVLFLNPDTQLYPGALSAVGRFLRTGAAEGVGICGAHMVDGRGRPTISCSRFPSLRVFLGKMTGLDRLVPALLPPHHLRAGETPDSGPVDQVIGAFFLVRRPLFTALGGFDERYFLYFEETDFALRARRQGWRSHHVGQAWVHHVGQVSSAQLGGSRLCFSLRSRTLYAFRHWSRGRAWLLVALTLTLEPATRLARALLRLSPSELGQTLRGYREFLAWLLRAGARWPARRALDVGFALTMLVVLSPLLAFLALLVRVTSDGPAVFRQRRVGEGAGEFTLYKFRSMRCDASGPAITARSDRRVTGTGGLLRLLGLDELPQLWNVLRGDMTLVGPRPEVPHLARRYPPECRWVFRHRPGLTGPCQLHSRAYAELLEAQPDPEGYYLRELVPRRVAIDGEFLEHATLSNVLRFTALTLWYVLSAGRPWAGRRGSGQRSGHAAQEAEGGRPSCVP